jgi:Zn-finger nucleic acid-binding protein
MQCPVCKDVSLVMADRQGVEIDYCPSCRGVWLDRGELDKIIDRSAGLAHAAPQAQPAPQPVQAVPRHDAYQPQQQQQQQHGWGHSASSHGHPQQGYQKKKKREGFLGELFDFD